MKIDEKIRRNTDVEIYKTEKQVILSQIEFIKAQSNLQEKEKKCQRDNSKGKRNRLLSK